MSTTTEQVRFLVGERIKTRYTPMSIELYEPQIMGYYNASEKFFDRYTKLKKAGVTNFEELPQPDIFDLFEVIELYYNGMIEVIKTYDLTKLTELFMLYEDEFITAKEFMKKTKYDNYIYNLLTIYEMRENTDFNNEKLLKLRQIQEKINAL